MTTETNFKALYIFRRFKTTLSVKLFEVTVQIFVYKLCLQLRFWKDEKKPHETFHSFFNVSQIPLYIFAVYIQRIEERLIFH